MASAKQIFDSVSLEASKLTTNSYSTSFSVGISFLDKSIHDEIYAIYGFVRFADEIVDTFHSFAKDDLLKEFEAETWKAIERKISLNPILNSFQWVVNKYKIDHGLIEAFLESMKMDLKEQIYDRELYEKYILGSAEVVGLMCLKVFVNGSETQYEELKTPAMKLGSAFQKVNFLRDLGEDNKTLGRSYFPQLQEERLNLNNKEELIMEIEKDFAEARPGIKMLTSNSRLGVYVAYSYYQDLLKKIKESSLEKINNNRIRISNLKKFFLASKAFFEEKLLLAIFLFVLALQPLSAASLDQIRPKYKEADESKKAVKAFNKLVEACDADAVSCAGYQVASDMFKAKYSFNPITKLKYFKKGREKMQSLISENPNNLELRYIRLSIQNATPGFLNYKAKMKEDQEILENHLKNSNQDLNSKTAFDENLERFLREKIYKDKDS